ncbi:MAG: tetratricopeptide repeat protein, partial [Candidatus Accumulibacter sp.]|nr:tetratricopeptide repeat protein [Accumulibacter sp.]
MQTCDFNSPGGRLGALKYAVSLFESGEFAQAEQLARKIRDAAPTDEHILRFLGQTVYKQGRVEEAATLIEGALKLNPMRAAYHNDLGAMFAEMNRWPDAEAAYRMAKVLDPGSIDAAFNLTLALARQEKTDAAWRELDALEKASPEFSEMPRLRGEILIAEKRYDKAVDVFSKAIERGLDTPDMHLGLGSALFHAGKRDEAFEVFFTSGKIDPENALANCHAGELMLEKGELKKARRLFEKAIEIDPMIGAAYNCLGILLEKEGDFSGAAAKFLRAIEVDPQNAPAYINLGNCHSRKNKRDAARACFQRALEIDPGLSSAWNNLALIFYSEHRFDEADEAFQKALLAAPDLPQTKFNQGLMRLSLGDFESGWVEYEERHALRAAENKGIHPQHAKLTCPKWSGEALGEKHLLIVPEQGFGDHIQFVRYFSVLRTRYPDARLSYMCNFLMFRLFSGIAAKYGVLLLLNFDTHDEAWDFFVPLLSLPMYAGGTKMSIPTDTPYLELPEAFVSKWGARLPTSDGKRVGIVWSGSEHYRAAGWRNMTLAQLAPLFEIPGISWISLQRLPKGDAGEHIRDEGFSEKIFDPMPDVKDFADTAAIIANLDLVISVDT